MRETRPVCGHSVGAGDCTERDSLLVGAVIAHHADRLNGQQHGERLPDVFVDPEIMKLVGEYFVGFLKKLDLFWGNFTEDANTKTGAGKRMPLEDHFGNAKISADRADLVFEKLTQGFDKLQVHFFRQAADVVMGLYGYGRTPHGNRLDDVRVKRALNQPFHIADLIGFYLKNIYELLADRPAFFFRIENAVKHGIKILRSVDA